VANPLVQMSRLESLLHIVCGRLSSLPNRPSRHQNTTDERHNLAK